MKKNISINISGIIFHIEEDGYDQLKEYLESINRYFSTFEDSHEIIADIETRIAELFLSKLKEDGKQVVGIEDVEELIATMGSIKDFQAAEEDSGYIVPEVKEPEKETADEGEPLFAKRLYRDSNRKLLGGVLSGIAYYFTIDPLWIRLLYVLLFFGISFLPSIAGFLFIAYIVMWIVIPGSDELKEEKKIKKMYRDPDGKVLGGVASGIAAYFGVDVVIIRLLFFAGIFIAGTGLILYLILWIILPEAKTLTDKMAMQGQPVTLSNIESNIKKSLNVQDSEENMLVKILLFPFRLIAALFEFLSRALGPFMSFLVEAIRVVFGVVLSIIGISGVLAAIILIGVLIGLFAGGDMAIMYPIPLEIIKNDLSTIPAVALGVAFIIPFFFIAILGFMVILKKKVLNDHAGWSILAIWLLSIAVLSVYIPKYINNYKEQGKDTTIGKYDLWGKTAVLQYNDIGDDEFDFISMQIKSHEDSAIKIEKVFAATGKTRLEAVENAKKIEYGLEVKDSVLKFDSNLSFGVDGRFRKQQVDITVYIPIGQKFMMDDGLRHLMGSYMYREGFSNSQLGDNVWQFDDEGLLCVTCPPEPENSSFSDDDSNWEIKGFRREYEIKDFSEVKINSPVTVRIKRGDRYSIIVNGKVEVVNRVVLDKTGKLLSIDYKRPGFSAGKTIDDLKIFITAPEINDFVFGSASRAYVMGFIQDDLNIHLTGAAMVEIEAEVQSLTAIAEGASKLTVHGNGEQLEAKVTGASTFNSFDFEVKNVNIEAHSASTANVFAKEQLSVRTFGASKVVYKGNAKVDIEKSGGSTVRKD